MTSISDLSTAVVFIVTFLGVYIAYRQRVNGNIRKYPPALRWVPVLGSLPFMATSAAEIPKFFLKKSASFGNVFAFYSGSKYAIVVNGASSIHEALVKKSTDFAGRMPFYALNKYILTEEYRGIALRQYDEKYKRLHSHILAIFKEFGYGKLLMETRILNEVTELIEHVKQLKGEAFDPDNIITSITLNIMYSILFGIRLDIGSHKMNNVIEKVHHYVATLVPELDVLPQLRFIPSYNRRMMTSVAATQDLLDCIASEIDNILDSETIPQSFVRSFTELDPDRTELVYITENLVTAGSETSSNTIRWGLVLLANHPEIQEHLHKEIDAFVPKERLPVLDDRPKLPYVQATILELMRYKTIVPLSLPHETTCDTELCGYFIPKDTTLQRLSKWWNRTGSHENIHNIDF